MLVTALPAIEAAQLPPLHAVDPQETFCARRAGLVLPVEGAPLVFATHYIHDVALSLSDRDGHTHRVAGVGRCAPGRLRG